jgi:hypothetical protein
MAAPLSPKLDWALANPLWAATLNPIIAAPQSSGSILKNIELVMGANTINHLLGRNMQGWSIVDINAAVTIYRSQPMNQSTLTLTASGPCTVNIEVF